MFRFTEELHMCYIVAPYVCDSIMSKEQCIYFRLEYLVGKNGNHHQNLQGVLLLTSKSLAIDHLDQWHLMETFQVL